MLSICQIFLAFLMVDFVKNLNRFLLDHQSKYLNWRIETGLLDLLEPLLSGGAAGLKAIVCGPKHDNI